MRPKNPDVPEDRKSLLRDTATCNVPAATVARAHYKDYISRSVCLEEREEARVTENSALLLYLEEIADDN